MRGLIRSDAHSFQVAAVLAAVIAAAATSPTSTYAQDGLRQEAEWNRALQQALDEAGAELRSDKPNEVAWGAFRGSDVLLRDSIADPSAHDVTPIRVG